MYDTTHGLLFLQESISTCRFAQRVAMIKNDVMLNEELDPKLMIQKLKREIQQLKEELALATGQQRTDQLTEEELDRCAPTVHSQYHSSYIMACSGYKYQLKFSFC